MGRRDALGRNLAADERFQPANGGDQDEAIRRKYGLPDEFVLYLGSFDIRKNVHNLLLAWTYTGPSLGEQIPLVLAGRQPQTWGTRRFPDLPQYARQLDIERYLVWLGEVDEDDKPSLYRLAKVVVFPSRYEGFGLPVLEAMACGTPVVAADASSIPEVAGEAAYLVDPDDARTLGAAILSILVQDDLRRHLANAGRGQATRFSWRKTAQKTLEIYEQVMRD
jgi:glycosyltransferase involved in cell wall biosynthesis